MLELTHIQKTFGTFPVLDIDHLLLGKGVYWLKGSNGAGKSTLLKILAGLLPFRGEVCLNKDISLRRHPVEYRVHVNHAEAEPAYPSFLRGEELISFVRSIKKGSAGQVDEVKRVLEIDNYLGNPTGSYSSGMLKKLSLLLSFIGHPQWILLDEPLTTLDQTSQKALCGLIMQQHREKGISFLLTSHHDIGDSLIHFDKAFTIRDKHLQEIKAGL